MKKLLIPFVIILFLSSCSTWKMVGEYDHDADFTTYKTFGLLSWDPHNDKEVSPRTKKIMLMAIKDEMEARGYVYQENNADLQISIFVIVQEETSYSAYAGHYAGYTGYGSVAVGVSVGSGGVGVGAVGYGMATTYPYTVVNHDYNVGTVIVDLWDSSKKKLIWQGVASGRITNEEAKEGKAKSKFGRLFLTLPVKKVKK